MTDLEASVQDFLKDLGCCNDLHMPRCDFIHMVGFKPVRGKKNTVQVEVAVRGKANAIEYVHGYSLRNARMLVRKEYGTVKSPVELISVTYYPYIRPSPIVVTVLVNKADVVRVLDKENEV